MFIVSYKLSHLLLKKNYFFIDMKKISIYRKSYFIKLFKIGSCIHNWKFKIVVNFRVAKPMYLHFKRNTFFRSCWGKFWNSHFCAFHYKWVIQDFFIMVIENIGVAKPMHLHFKKNYFYWKVSIFFKVENFQ